MGTQPSWYWECFDWVSHPGTPGSAFWSPWWIIHFVMKGMLACPSGCHLPVEFWDWHRSVSLLFFPSLFSAVAYYLPPYPRAVLNKQECCDAEKTWSKAMSRRARRCKVSECDGYLNRRGKEAWEEVLLIKQLLRKDERKLFRGWVCCRITNWATQAWWLLSLWAHRHLVEGGMRIKPGMADRLWPWVNRCSSKKSASWKKKEQSPLGNNHSDKSTGGLKS